MDGGGESHDCDVSVETFRRSDKKDDLLRQSNKSGPEEDKADQGSREQRRRGVARGMGKKPGSSNDNGRNNDSPGDNDTDATDARNRQT